MKAWTRSTYGELTNNFLNEDASFQVLDLFIKSPLLTNYKYDIVISYLRISRTRKLKNRTDIRYLWFQNYGFQWFMDNGF